MNHEFARLTAAQQAAVRRVIAKAQSEAGQHNEFLPDGGEAYAYSGAHGTHWGVNGGEHGFCIARGIWPQGERA